jgi:hypothetical protein
MAVPKIFDDIIQYFSGAVSRIFGTSDDSYPNTGVQPFEGEPTKKTRHSENW